MTLAFNSSTTAGNGTCILRLSSSVAGKSTLPKRPNMPSKTSITSVAIWNGCRSQPQNCVITTAEPLFIITITTGLSNTAPNDPVRKRCCSVISAISCHAILRWSGITVFWPTTNAGELLFKVYTPLGLKWKKMQKQVLASLKKKFTNVETMWSAYCRSAYNKPITGPESWNWIFISLTDCNRQESIDFDKITFIN